MFHNPENYLLSESQFIYCKSLAFSFCTDESPWRSCVCRISSIVTTIQSLKDPEISSFVVVGFGLLIESVSIHYQK
jgi:hypothetical protein